MQIFALFEKNQDSQQFGVISLIKVLNTHAECLLYTRYCAEDIHIVCPCSMEPSFSLERTNLKCSGPRWGRVQAKAGAFLGEPQEPTWEVGKQVACTGGLLQALWQHCGGRRPGPDTVALIPFE